MTSAADEQTGRRATAVNSIYDLSPTVLEALAQWIEQRGLTIPLSQISGVQAVKPFRVGVYRVGSLGTTTSTSWTTFGSTVATNIRAGQYIGFMSARVGISSATEQVTMALRLNSTDAFASGAGVHAAGGSPYIFSDGALDGTGLISISETVYFTLTQDLNTVTPVWTVSGGTGSFARFTALMLPLGYVAGQTF